MVCSFNVPFHIIGTFVEWCKTVWADEGWAIIGIGGMYGCGGGGLDWWYKGGRFCWWLTGGWVAWGRCMGLIFECIWWGLGGTGWFGILAAWFWTRFSDSRFPKQHLQQNNTITRMNTDRRNSTIVKMKSIFKSTASISSLIIAYTEMSPEFWNLYTILYIKNWKNN